MKLFLFLFFCCLHNSVSFRKYTLIRNKINNTNETLMNYTIIKNQKQNTTKIDFTDEHMRQALLLF